MAATGDQGTPAGARLSHQPTRFGSQTAAPVQSQSSSAASDKLRSQLLPESLGLLFQTTCFFGTATAVNAATYQPASHMLSYGGTTDGVLFAGEVSGLTLSSGVNSPAFRFHAYGANLSEMGNPSQFFVLPFELVQQIKLVAMSPVFRSAVINTNPLAVVLIQAGQGFTTSALAFVTFINQQVLFAPLPFSIPLETGLATPTVAPLILYDVATSPLAWYFTADAQVEGALASVLIRLGILGAGAGLSTLVLGPATLGKAQPRVAFDYPLSNSDGDRLVVLTPQGLSQIKAGSGGEMTILSGPTVPSLHPTLVDEVPSKGDTSGLGSGWNDLSVANGCVAMYGDWADDLFMARASDAVITSVLNVSPLGPDNLDLLGVALDGPGFADGTPRGAVGKSVSNPNAPGVYGFSVISESTVVSSP